MKRWEPSLKEKFIPMSCMNQLFQEVRSLKSALLDWNQGASWNTIILQTFLVFSWLLAFLSQITLNLCIRVDRCLCVHVWGWGVCMERETETGIHTERSCQFSKNSGNDIWSLLRQSRTCLHMFREASFAATKHWIYPLTGQ